MQLRLSWLLWSCSLIITTLTLKSDAAEEQDKKLEYFAYSPSKLVSLAELDHDIYPLLYNAIKSRNLCDTKLSTDILMYLKDYENSVLRSHRTDGIRSNILQSLNRTITSLQVASNPIKAYRLIKRTVLFSSSILDRIQINNSLIFSWSEFASLKNLIQDKRLPTSEDLDDSIMSLLRIQLYHNLRAKEMSKGIFGTTDTGNFKDTKTKPLLSASDMVKIGNYAASLNRYVYAVEWLELAVSKLQQKSFFSTYASDYRYKQTELLKEAQHDLHRVKSEHDRSWDELKYSRDVKQKVNLFVNKISDSHNTATPIKRVTIVDLLNQLYENIKDEDEDPYPLHFRSLCAGKNYQTPEEKRLLHCWYERYVHPYWKINPLKVELLHANPKLIQVYDFVGDEFIKKVRNAVGSTLKPAKTVTANGTLQVNSYRVSASSWIYHRWNYAYLVKYYQKVEFFTGLNALKFSAAEDLQIAGYTFGGHYGQHHDCLRYEKLIEENGQRIGTFMLYMSNVKAGGYTAFPVLGTAAVPVKGSAVFWYNIKRNGTCDLQLKHGACPVILDHKYVANIWIRSKDNFLNRRCGLNSAE